MNRRRHWFRERLAASTFGVSMVRLAAAATLACASKASPRRPTRWKLPQNSIVTRTRGLAHRQAREGAAARPLSKRYWLSDSSLGKEDCMKR